MLAGLVAAFWAEISVAAILVGLFATAIFGFSAYSIWRGLSTLRWTSTQGKVLESKVVRSLMASEDKGPGYEPSVQYEYSVAGKEYKGSQIALVQALRFTRGRAEDIARQYREGSRVTVYYDPKDPSSSVLQRGMTTFAPFVGLLAGVFLFMVAYRLL